MNEIEEIREEFRCIDDTLNKVKIYMSDLGEEIYNQRQLLEQQNEIIQYLIQVIINKI